MDEDELDPRIQVELEKLNSATDIINKLEIELDEANTTFRMLLNECTRRLKVHSSKHGSAIENARPYYEALEIARRAQQDCQQAAVSFQRANEVHEAAKETVALAESRFMSQQPEWRFDSAWQEMLNHATLKVRDAEKQRAESSAHHGRTTAVYKDAQEKIHMLEQRLRRNVAKSRPYFEEKQRCNEQLAAQKEAVETLAAKVARVKKEYAESLRRLEEISEEIHRKRGNIQMGGCGVREPGVGAELEYTGEQENRDTSRETSFDKTSYNYDAKFDANNLPDSSKNDTAIHTKDCDETVDVGSLQPCAGTATKIPGVRSVPDTRGPPDNRTSHGGGERKISFDSLHSSRFNPNARRDDNPDSESENEVTTDVSRDLLPEFMCPPAEARSQGKRSLSADRKVHADAVTIERGRVGENGATDDNSNVGEEEDFNTDAERACDRLKGITLQGNEVTRDGNDDIIEATMETSVGSSDACAQGDAGSGSKNEAPGEQTTSADTLGVDPNVRPVSECSNTLLSRQPDLELTFQLSKTTRKGEDRDAALELPSNTPGESQDSEIPAAEPRAVSN